MSASNEFDLLSTPLQGRNLIEASAGTGKTYTIARVFLRLLLEQNIEVDRILVVTFTEAATNELKARIHAVLQDARDAFAGHCSEDLFVRNYVKRRRNRELICKRLQIALENFDQAAVLTIHGFCSRVLQENAFESGGLFEPELVTEQTEILRQVVHDYWRQNTYRCSRMFVQYAMSEFKPVKLLTLLANRVGMPYARILPQVEPVACDQVESRFQDAYTVARDLWLSEFETVGSMLKSTSSLKKNFKAYKPENVDDVLQRMAAYFSNLAANPQLFVDFERHTTTKMVEATKKKCITPRHAFFDACEELYKVFLELQAAYEVNLLVLKVDLFDYAHTELQRRKKERNILYFDDLLVNVHESLSKDDNSLAEAVCAKYDAALIDEFQDTDPVQYEIFQRIFGRNNRPFFLIGDPKQAIYGFRGADIFSYMRAKQHTPAEKQHTLLTNYRSAPNLLDATNAVFSSGAGEPFIYPEIPFRQAVAEPRANVPSLTIAGKPANAMHLWFLGAQPHNENGRTLGSWQANHLIIEAVAAEISRLLALAHAGKARLGDRALEERDIAVLVRSNKQAIQLQARLNALNVHSVLYSSENLFKSCEAQDIERILSAVVEPRRQSVVMAALATETLGSTGDDLFRLVENDSDFEFWFDRFMDYHQLWRDHGFVRMFREFMTVEAVANRLMAYPDGERRMTNLLHLVEILNQASSGGRFGMTGLLKWLSEQRSVAGVAAEEYQLRLESDETAVKLVTMHMSKGLQYPVVFCPFTWGSSRASRDGVLQFHSEQDHTLTFDLGSPDFEAHKRLVEKEELASNLRVMYVAATRAQSCCYLVWGRFRDGATSAPGYLFHPSPLLDRDNLVESLKNHLGGYDDAHLRGELDSVVAASGGAIELSDLPAGKVAPLVRRDLADESLSARDFSAKVDSGARISSFSALVSGHPHGAEIADHDEAILTAPDARDEPEALDSFLDFPRGAKAGNFVHDVLEHLDFAQVSSEETARLVRTKLEAYGFERKWEDAVRNMLESVCTIPLDGAKENLRLSQLSAGQRINEMEFYFPLKSISPQTLRTLFSETAADLPNGFPERVGNLTFSPMKGFMKGFVDLVFEHQGKFYILDWKSNYLGAGPDRYNPDALARAMVDSFYVLQYHIYTLALHKYLAARVAGYSYEKHFGGVFYVFLRGFSQPGASSSGVFRDRPAAKLVHELENQLIGFSKQTGKKKLS